jgi:hypothetical protein
MTMMRKFILLLTFVLLAAILQPLLAQTQLKNPFIVKKSSPGISIDRYKKNPMHYNYVEKYGDYLKDLSPPYNDTILGKQWYIHFMHFPITFWIEPCKPEERALILQGIKQYATYFPMQEVKSKAQAYLVIDIVSTEELMKLCGPGTDLNVLGCGGPQYQTSKLGANTGRQYRGFLHLKQNGFYIPGAITIIVHELGHAFGISGHSKNQSDIMYYALDTWALIKKTENAKKIPKHLTYRDLNTLYLIYNDWHDK